MKKILLSILTVGIVAVGVVYATGAFFSDTETSTGNKLVAGAIDLKIDSDCTYNGLKSEECGTFGPTDLGPTSEKFFNFSDLKPGDQGENTISLDLSSNPAHACLIIENMSDDDLGLTEPEGEDGDITDGVGKGELSPELHFFAWADTNGNNVWENGEAPLFSNIEGPASDVLGGKSYYLNILQPGTTYLGVYWCFGDLTVGVNTLSCDGSAVTNLSQTDSLTADLRFYVEQARHNQEFKCPEPRNTRVVVDAQSLSLQTWFGYNDENDTVDNTLVSFVAGPTPAPSGNGSAQMTVSGTQRRNLATQLFQDTKLADIDSMQFSTFWASGQPGSERAIYLNFNVSFDGNNTWQRRIAYVPAVNGVVTTDVWQTWDTTNGLWWWSGYSANGNKWPDNDTDEYRTWAELVSVFPNIKMLGGGLGWLGFRAGEPYADGFTGNVDKFLIGINGVTTVYDFEQ